MIDYGPDIDNSALQNDRDVNDSEHNNDDGANELRKKWPCTGAGEEQ